jgi:hypothetical protein
MGIDGTEESEGTEEPKGPKGPEEPKDAVLVLGSWDFLSDFSLRRSRSNLTFFDDKLIR